MKRSELKRGKIQSWNSTLKNNGAKMKVKAQSFNSTLRPRTLKRAKEERQYHKMLEPVMRDCYVGGVFLSELNGEKSLYVENHHIIGRRGADLFNPFNWIILTPAQHRFEQAHSSFERRQYLKDLVRARRIAQGFDPREYGEELPQ